MTEEPRRHPGSSFIAEARVETERAAQYLEQLCRHAGKMRGLGSRLHRSGGHTGPQILEVERDGEAGTLRLAGGATVAMRAATGELILRAQAPSAEGLVQVEELVGRRLATLGSRERLVVGWIAQQNTPTG